jgi:hypothetical protein
MTWQITESGNQPGQIDQTVDPPTVQKSAVIRLDEPQVAVFAPVRMRYRVIKASGCWPE